MLLFCHMIFLQRNKSIFKKILLNTLLIHVLLLFGLIMIHLLELKFTKFTDWPEIMLYPWLVKQGLRLYKDMYIAYPPLSVYLTLFYFNLTGYTLNSYKALTYGIIIVNDVLLYSISLWLWKNKRIATAVCLFYIFLQVPLEGNSLWHELMFLPLLLLSYICLCKYISSTSLKFLIFSGILLGIAFLIKQTVFWIILSSIIFIFFYHIRKPPMYVTRTFLFMFPAIALFLALYFYYLFQESGKEYFFWVIQYPLSLANNHNSYAFMPSWKLIIQIAAMYISLPMACLLVFSQKISYRQRWFMTLCIVQSASLIFATLPRWGVFRFQSSLGFMVLSVGFIIDNFKIFWKNSLLKYTGIAILIPSISLSFHYISWFYLIGNTQIQQFMGPKQQSLVSKIANIIDNQSFYLMGDYDYFYFLLQKKPYVLPWTHHFPWMLDSAKLYTPILQRLENQQIQYIIMTPKTISPIFLTYIWDKYEQVYTLSTDAVVMKRRN